MTNIEKILLTTIIGASLGGIVVSVNTIIQTKKNMKLLNNIQEKCDEIVNEESE
jgi:cell division protein FtsL